MQAQMLSVILGRSISCQTWFSLRKDEAPLPGMYVYNRPSVLTKVRAPVLVSGRRLS